MRSFNQLALVMSLAFPLSAGAADLATILGSPTNEWRISQVSGTSNDFTVASIEGGSMLSAGPNGTALASLKPIGVDKEITYHVRLAPKDGKAATIYFFSGLKDAADAGHNRAFLQLHIPAAAEQPSVFCQMPPLPGEASGLYVPYTPYYLPKSHTAWPEMVRARAEQDMAGVAPLFQRWLTVRLVFRKDSVEAWADGRLLRITKDPDITPGGHVRIQLYDGTHLASVRVRDAAEPEPKYEPVALDHYVNARETAKTALPNRAGDVPFASTPGEAIDVGRSWMRFGLLEGAFDGWEGDTARWRNAFQVEPNRLKFRVRNRPYVRMHLLASYDGAPDTTNVLSVQFYRPDAGFPVTFSTRVTGSRPHLVTIPLEPNGLASLSDLPVLEFELTKAVQIYRAFPDPCYYSEHGAGLPSGVRVYGITLERADVEADLQPDHFAHLWTSPSQPSYTVTLSNRAKQDRTVSLELATVSHDRLEKTSQSQRVTVPPGGETKVRLPIALKRYGHHDVKLTLKDSQGTRTHERSLAFQHPDTRERGGWEEGKGPLFGFWDWGGGHVTPGGLERLEVAVAAGIESSMRPFATNQYKANELAFAEKHGMMTHYHSYQLSMHKGLLGVEFDASKPAEMEAALIDALKKSPLTTPTKLNKPEFSVMFGEPIVGPISYMSLPEYYGDPPYQMTDAEKKNFQNYLDQFLIMGRAIKKTWPGTKLAFPWGIPSFPIAYLRHSPEARDLMDGPAVDLILFERLPEMQMHQVTYASTMWQLKQEWLKAGKQWPKLISVEGVCSSPATPGALTQEQEAAHTIRGAMLLFVYDVTRQLGWPSLFRCAGAWGEQHYGSGIIERLPLATPKVLYSAYATMTRQLNRMNFVKMIETGSATVFCLQFKHYKSGELLHVFWTVRGTRPVTLDQSAGVRAYDSMDNDIAAQPLLVGTSPCYVWGLKDGAKFSLGDPDHSDARPSRDAMKLGNLGDGSWTLSSERDTDYENAHPEFVKKFPGKMTVQPASAPKEAGAKALAVHLEKQDTERKTMPFYTTLVPSKPIPLAGKPSHLGLWVRAASDWGRFVYCLRDAKSERWLNIGKAGEWNVDDVHCWSAFNFDGWRYLTFEMPGNQPWDCYRDMGTSFWGYYGKGDGVVDLPLTLEKVIVERRTHVIKADQLIPANPEDVLIGDLLADYERPSDKTEEVIRQSRLRMTQGSGAAAGAISKPQDYNPYR